MHCMLINEVFPESLMSDKQFAGKYKQFKSMKHNLKQTISTNDKNKKCFTLQTL